MKNLSKDFKIIARSFHLINKIDGLMIPLYVISPIINALFPFINIYMSAQIINGLIEKDKDKLIYIVILTLAANLIVGLTAAAINHLKNIHETLFYTRQKLISAEKVMSLDYETLDSKETHDKRTRIDEEHEILGFRLLSIAGQIEQQIKCLSSIGFSVGLTYSMFFRFTTNPSGGIAGFINSSWFSWLLLLFIITVTALNAYVATFQGKTFMLVWSKFLSFNNILQFFGREYLDTNKTGKEIRIFNQSDLIMRDYGSARDNQRRLQNELGRKICKFDAFQSFILSLITGSVYLFVGLKALYGAFGVGSLVLYIGTITQFFVNVRNLTANLTSTGKILNYLRPYWAFMDIESGNYKGTLTTEKRADNEYEIEFHMVSFKYPGNEKYALRNFSLKLNIGQKLAVVGMNGSGKTTMIKLLCRLYDPTEGEITMNGIDIRKYDMKEYINLFSVVFQDFALFSFTVGQNVAATREYDKRIVEDCLKIVGFGERLSTMPNGVDTYVYKNYAEDGVEISGGEAQKMALARALYKNAPFIVLDEPTAALDPIAEFEIYSKFNEIVGDKTAIYISHRLSSCRFCDDIAVFHEGELIQRGNHDALLEDKNGKYYELWNAQAQYYNDKAV